MSTDLTSLLKKFKTQIYLTKKKLFDIFVVIIFPTTTIYLFYEVYR